MNISSFTDAVKQRRSIYTLQKKSPVSNAVIQEHITDILLHVPSAFNSQSARVLLLFGDEHDALWDIVRDTLKPIVPPENFPTTESKIAGFKNAFGTVLYFDDTAVTDGLAHQFTAYAENFETWAEQANGMLQFAIWTLLESLGLGANLQHYNPLIDEAVQKRFDLPETWCLRAQMPFGAYNEIPSDKEKQPINERLIIRF